MTDFQRLRRNVLREIHDHSATDRMLFFSAAVGKTASQFRVQRCQEFFNSDLPIVQVAITAVLEVWADRVDWILLADTSRTPGRFLYLDLSVIEARMIWRGINAPAYPLCLAGSLTRQIIEVLKTMSYFLMMAWGIFLLFVSLWTIRAELSFAGSYFLRIDAFVVAALFLAWSLILLILAGRRLVGGIHRKNAIVA
jgi:hypothetical protein